MKNRKTVVSVIGSGRSGSTLLTLMLGSHSKCFSLGELDKFYRYHRQQRNICGICQTNCEIWDRAFDEKSKQKLSSILGNTRLTDWLPLSMERNLRELTGTDNVFNAYSIIFSKLSKDIDIIIDSSKQTEWVLTRLKSHEFRSGLLQHKVIHIVRDGRAVISSIKRIRPSKSVAEITREWMEKVESANRFMESISPTQNMLVRYEDIVLNTDKELSRICDFLDISFYAEMKCYWQFNHHLIAGNTGTRSLILKHRQQEISREIKHKQGDYYDNLGLQLKLDLRWKTELSSEDLAVFDNISGDFNKPYSFEA